MLTDPLLSLILLDLAVLVLCFHAGRLDRRLKALEKRMESKP